MESNFIKNEHEQKNMYIVIINVLSFLGFKLELMKPFSKDGLWMSISLSLELWTCNLMFYVFLIHLHGWLCQ